MSAARPITVGVVGGTRLFREALGARLAMEPWLHVAGVAESAVELLDSPSAGRPGIVLVRVSPAADPEALEVWQLKAALPAARLIALAPRSGEGEVLPLMEAGACACVAEDAPCAELLAAIRRVAAGETACSLSLLGLVARRIAELDRPGERRGARAPVWRLSEQEEEVARLVEMGLRDKQIGRRLGVKTPTVKRHVHNILCKLGLRGRREIARRGPSEAEAARRLLFGRPGGPAAPGDDSHLSN